MVMESITTRLLRHGCRQLHRNGVKNWRCILRPSALRHLVLHRLGEPIILWRLPFPRHANVHVVIVMLRRWFRRGRFVSVTTTFEAVLYALARGVADTGAIPVVLLRV